MTPPNRHSLFRSRRLITAVGSIGVVALGLVASTGLVLALAGVVTGSPSNFESGDGNMVLNASNDTDWNCFQGTSAFAASASYGSGFTAADCKVTSGAVQQWSDGGTTGVGTNELEVKSGQKFDTACPAFIVGNNPPKDEWSNIAEYTELDSSNNLYFYGASIRPVVNGNSSGNVYFNQSATGCHTAGDILLTFDFLSGGGNPVLHSLQWVTTGSCFVSQDSPPCWGNQQAITGTNFNGNVNTAPIAGGDNGINGQDLAANAFSEFGINLTQAIKAGGGTPPACFANQTWESRSSGSSFTSNPEDVEVVNHPTCGSITVIKHTLNGPGTRSGINQQFSYSTTGGLTPSSFHLNDAGGATGDVACTADSTTTSPCNSTTYSNVPAGTYTVAEGAEPSNFAFVSLTCTHAGSGTTTSTSTVTATINLGLSGSAVCTYVNQQQLGAIRINKTSTKASAALAGASFYLCTNNTTSTTSCTAPTGVTNPLTTDANGTVCRGSLPFATYYVFESAAPTGYAINDATAHSANVNAFGTCSTSTSQTVTLSFTDTPLSKIYLGWHSLAGSGVTTATIQCTGETSAAPFTDGGSPAAITKTLGDGTSTLTPGTYTCTIVIDP